MAASVPAPGTSAAGARGPGRGCRARGTDPEAGHGWLAWPTASCHGQQRREGHGSHEGEEQQQRAAHEEVLREVATPVCDGPG